MLHGSARLSIDLMRSIIPQYWEDGDFMWFFKGNLKENWVRFFHSKKSKDNAYK